MNPMTTSRRGRGAALSAIARRGPRAECVWWLRRRGQSGLEADRGTGDGPARGCARAARRDPLRSERAPRGGTEAFKRRLEELRGFPIVVNKWASWCGPCRFEFPWFQSAAEERGGRSRSSASIPTTPRAQPSSSSASFRCRTLIQTPALRSPGARWSATGVPGDGVLRPLRRARLHAPGGYADEQDLIADIERYAR